MEGGGGLLVVQRNFEVVSLRSAARSDGRSYGGCGVLGTGARESKRVRNYGSVWRGMN